MLNLVFHYTPLYSVLWKTLTCLDTYRQLILGQTVMGQNLTNLVYNSFPCRSFLSMNRRAPIKHACVQLYCPCNMIDRECVAHYTLEMKNIASRMWHCTVWQKCRNLPVKLHSVALYCLLLFTSIRTPFLCFEQENQNKLFQNSLLK